MRKTKFRISKIDENQNHLEWEIMCFPDDLVGETYMSGNKYNFQTLCQYTGLEDKNKKEIFEGDILQMLNTLAKVIFQDGAFVLYGGIGAPTGALVHDVIKRVETTVVGNVFENHNLFFDSV